MVQLEHILIPGLVVALASCRGHDGTGEPGPYEPDRPVIYQLVVRHFGNTRGTNVRDGDMAENGVGKFEHIDATALSSLRQLGVTHIWLTGVLQQATHTDHSAHGQPADDPDVLKGKAGSFYAVRDYFDVCPDYALDPGRRMEEFEALVARIHAAGMKVVIDLVPNHVARTYHSDVRPDLDFGAGDDTSVFFSPHNSFFYLVDPPGQALSLPAPVHWSRPEGADGTLETEDGDGDPPGDVPRATGNNQTAVVLTENDWYETVKLNWGYDFVSGEASFDPVPGTWIRMDAVIAHWQDKGVDGFRCDFAHWVPIQAWEYLVGASRARDPDAFFFAEAYESADAPPVFSLPNLVAAGFDAVYDDRVTDTLKAVTCCGGRASDLDAVLPGDLMFDRTLRYGENHDERRLASPVVPGDDPDASGMGSATAAKPLVGTLFLSSSGPILVYNGQEVGETGAGDEGFGGEDGRTSIFDYWTVPRLALWVSGYAYDGSMLDPEGRALREWYARLIALARRPGFASGNFYSLQSANTDRPGYTSGQYIYSFLRYDTTRGAIWLVVSNHSDTSHHFDLFVSREPLEFIGVDPDRGTLTLTDAMDEGAATVIVRAEDAQERGIEMTLSPYELRVYALSLEDP